MGSWLILIVWFFSLIACNSLPVEKSPPDQPEEISLKIINYNTWHGLGTGFLKRKLLEPVGRKSLRFSEQLHLLKEAKPDILFLQEVNPVSSLSRQIANDLGMSYVYQTTNCGISLLGAGIPINLSMGIAILVRPPLEVQKIAGFKLSGGPGFCKKLLSFQYGEFRYALFALAYHPSYGSFLLANTHLHHGPEWSAVVRDQLDEWVSENVLTTDQEAELFSAIEQSNQRRASELNYLFSKFREINNHYNEIPFILAGDFNSTPSSPIYESILEDHQLTDTKEAYSSTPYTWNPEINHVNHSYTSGFGVEVPTFNQPEIESFFKEYDSRQRRIDYVFVSSDIEVKSYDLFANSPNADGLIGSDHFGVEVFLSVGNP